MAITQRFDELGSRHPRMTFTLGLTGGATLMAGIVLSAAVAVGAMGQTESATIEQTAAGVSAMSDAQQVQAEQDYRTAHGVGATVGAWSGLTDEQIAEAELEYRATHGIGFNSDHRVQLTDEQIMLAEEDYRQARGIGR